MTTAVLNRRTLLAAGGAVLAIGVSGLLLPARAEGVAPTPSMSGGANNYVKGAPTVERIIPIFGQPHGHLAYDSGEFRTVFLRPVMRSAKETSLEAHFVLQPA